MVRMGDFQIQLVEATTNVPFAEYYHEGQIYVETPRGTEFFIAVSKPQAKLYSGSIILRFYLDGKYLGYNLTYAATRTCLRPKYKGRHSHDCEGSSTDTPLRFLDERRFGKVKVKIYPAVMAEDGRVRYDRKCLLSTMTLLCTPDLTQANILHCATMPVKKANQSNPVQESSLSHTTETNRNDSIKPISATQKMRWEWIPDCKFPVHPDTTTLADEDDTTEIDTSETTEASMDWGSFVFVEPDLAVIALDDREVIS
jgi:hypothetical protein